MMLGVLIVMATDTAGKQQATTGDQEETDPDKAGEDGLKAGADGKYTQEQHEALLGNERDRLDIKGKDLQKQFDDAVAKGVKEGQQRAEMSELEKAKTDLAATQAERDALTERVAAAEAHQEQTEWISANAGDLDRAWRVYLDQELSAAPETETRENVLARVQKERDEEQGGTGTSLGVAGRPGQQSKPQTGKDMNRAIRRAAGRKA